ncbi:MAG TPA: PASTA domain-containing protein, partial [Chloroflexota bacterium]
RLSKEGRVLKRASSITAPLATSIAVLTAVTASLALAAGQAGAASIVFMKGGNVWLASPDGSVVRQVTSGGGWDSPSQADDGTILAQRGTQLFRMGRGGNPLAPAINTTFTGAPATWAGPVNAVISPDGVNQAYDGEITDSGYYDSGCGCYVYTHTFATWWGSATTLSQPNQTLGQQDYVDPAWIDNGHLMLSATGILIAQVATYALGAGDNAMTPWFSDPDPNLQGLGSGAITRSADKLAFVANVQGGVGNEIRIYSATGPPPVAGGPTPSAPADTCNLGPNNFQSLRVSFAPDGQSLAYDAPDGIHLRTLTGWPSCTSATDKLIIPGASEPYFGPADVGPPTPSATPTPTPGARPISTQCTVPRLHGLGLAVARRLLQRAHCRLGHVRTGRSAHNKHRGLVIISQQPAAGGIRPRNATVNVQLGRAAPTPHHH